jgi:hypothetical protein
MQTIGMVSEGLSGHVLSIQNTDLEEAIAVLVKDVNGILRIINEASGDDMVVSKDSDKVQGSFQKLQEIFIAAVKTSEASSRRSIYGPFLDRNQTDA